MTYLVRPSVFDEMLTRGGVTNPFERSLLEPLFVKNGKTNGLNTNLNVYEDNANYYVQGLFPGLTADKIELSVKENVLTIAGEYNYSEWPQVVAQPKEGETNGNGNSFRTLLNEVPQGKFSRQIKFALAFDQDKIQAHFENGLLKLTLPKSERNQPKRINITSAQ